jgi:hypothetical protein
MSSPLLTASMALLLIGVSASTGSSDDVAQRVVDVPTRPGVTQRFLLLSPREPKATVVLFAGDHGGLQIAADGRFQYAYLVPNFLVRSRQLFVEHDLAVAIVDAPSDRQGFLFPRYLWGFRQTPAHAADIKAVIAWLREHVEAPVWLIGTSRGTESVGYLATQLKGRDGPDGIVLTSTILADGERSVPAMELETLRIPVLVVHHEQDGCRFCLFRDMPALMHKLDAVPMKELIAVNGGVSSGDPCQAFAYHGYNGIESTVVARIAEWIVSR